MKTTLLALVFLFVQAASAQEACDTKETATKCLSRLSKIPEVNAESEASSKASASAEEEIRTDAPGQLWEQLASKATGLNLSEAGLDSATENFLPLFRFALAATGLENDFNPSTLNIERKIGYFGTDHSWELKLKGAVNEAEVYAPLKAAFNEQNREQRTNDLKAELDDFDDYSLSLYLNRSNQNYGRTPNAYSQDVFAYLLGRVVNNTKVEEDADSALLEIMDEFGTRGVASPETKTFEELREIERLGTIPAGSAERLEQAVLAAARGTLLTVEALKKKAGELAIFDVADLLNNQPQINGSGNYRLRKGAAGPNEITVKVTYEYGFANLNRLRTRCGQPDAQALDPAFEDCYSTFMKNNQGRMKSGDRFSFTAEYNELEAFKFILPADQIDLSLPSQNGLALTLTYARMIDTNVLGDSNSRIDLSGKYESKDDRGVVTLTYTNRVFKSLGGAIGISYANHERFLPESDSVLSAHFGLSFNSFPKTPPKTP